MQEQTKQQFREDEVALIRYWDKKTEDWVTNVYPKIGGRLRLAHDENQELNIETEIYKYDENIAVVIASCKTDRGNFKGIGMSSVGRDEKIAPAILELAETRAISRSLRFAGYGVEYCSAEEVSHLQSGNGSQANDNRKQGSVDVRLKAVGSNVYKPAFTLVRENQEEPVNGNGGNGNDNNGNKKRLSHKQYNYIKSLGKSRGYEYGNLTRQAIDTFGTEIEYLNTSEASSFIKQLHAGL